MTRKWRERDKQMSEITIDLDDYTDEILEHLDNNGYEMIAECVNPFDIYSPSDISDEMKSSESVTQELIECYGVEELLGQINDSESIVAYCEESIGGIFIRRHQEPTDELIIEFLNYLDCHGYRSQFIQHLRRYGYLMEHITQVYIDDMLKQERDHELY